MDWRRLWTLFLFAIIVMPPVILYHQLRMVRQDVTSLQHSLDLVRADAERLRGRLVAMETEVAGCPKMALPRGRGEALPRHLGEALPRGLCEARPRGLGEAPVPFH